eukprot:2917990-Rhodomonas_salina.1
MGNGVQRQALNKTVGGHVTAFDDIDVLSLQLLGAELGERASEREGVRVSTEREREREYE